VYLYITFIMSVGIYLGMSTEAFKNAKRHL
jgi:hypothetical protein